MALTGKKANNTQVIEGISWEDRYVITGSDAAALKNVMRVGGSDISGSFTERAIVWTDAGITPSTYQALLPNGTLIVDVNAKKLYMISASVALTSSIFVA
jgi:hypothetical protein